MAAAAAFSKWVGDVPGHAIYDVTNLTGTGTDALTLPQFSQVQAAIAQPTESSATAYAVAVTAIAGNVVTVRGPAAKGATLHVWGH